MIYPIKPVPKPRMTRGDKYPPFRDPVQRYWDFKDECTLRKVEVPEANAHITFHIPMPPSWSKKKRAEMEGKPHKSRPDKDNLEKALLDAVHEEDSHVWDSRVTKRWAVEGAIEIVDMDQANRLA